MLVDITEWERWPCDYVDGSDSDKHNYDVGDVESDKHIVDFNYNDDAIPYPSGIEGVINCINI